MTNTELFRNKVEEIGVTYTFIAQKSESPERHSIIK